MRVSGTGLRDRHKVIDKMFLTAFILFTLSTARGNLTHENACLVTPVSERPGLYYERVSPLRLQHVDWRVVTFIDIRRFIKDIPIIEDQLLDTLEICVNASVHKGTSVPLVHDKCRAILRTDFLMDRIAYAKSLVDDLVEIAEDSKIEHPAESPLPRTVKKRSVPFGFIGTLSKSLFGTMNVDDATYLNTQIDRLFSDQSNITRLIGK